MKKLSLLLVAGHCFAISLAQPLQAKPVILTATLIHADSSTPKAMAMNFLNPFIKGRKSVAFDETGNLSSAEEMLFTQNMTVQYNKVFINLYVQPGDSVHLQIDGALLSTPNFGWLTISGDHAQISTQLNQWHYAGSKIPYKKYDYTVPAISMLDTIKADYARHMAVFEKYASEHALDPIVKNWAIRDIKYGISNWVSDYLSMLDSPSGKWTDNAALFVQSFFDPYDRANFQSMMFPYHLGAYVHALLKADSNISIAQQQGRYQDAATKGIQKVLHEPAGLSRDYMLFNFLSYYLTKSPKLLDSLPGLGKNFLDPVAYRYLLRVADEIANAGFTEKPISGIIHLSKDSLKLPVPSVEIFNYLAKRHAGKVLYVDIYATWCVPCLQEMAYLPALKEKLDTSKVAFINLCLQSDEAGWLDVIKKRKLTGENYFLKDDATKLFMGLYRIEGFPTYMLFDRSGKLKTASAPRPSETERLMKAVTNLIEPDK